MAYKLEIEEVSANIHKTHDNVYSKLCKIVDISKCQVYQADFGFESALVQDDIIILNKKIFLPESIEYESFNSFNNKTISSKLLLKVLNLFANAKGSKCFIYLICLLYIKINIYKYSKKIKLLQIITLTIYRHKNRKK